MVDYIRVLLVDDDEIVRMALTGALEQSGFVVTTAAGVPEALKLISGPETFDVLLSDLHMPGAGMGSRSSVRCGMPIPKQRLCS